MWESADCFRWAGDCRCVNWGRSEGFCFFLGCGPGPGHREGRRGSWFFSLLFLTSSRPGSALRVPIPVSQCGRQGPEHSCGLYSWKTVFFFSFLSQCDLARAWSQCLEWKGDISTQALFWDSGQFLSGSHLAFSVTLSSGTILILHCSSQSFTVTSPCFSEVFFFQGFLVFLKIFSRAMCCSKCGGRKQKLASEVTAWLGHSKWELRFSGHFGCFLCCALNDKRVSHFAKFCSFFFFLFF